MIVGVLMFPLFFIWAPWISAKTPDEIRAKYGRNVPSTWEAVTVEHGEFLEWEFGTVAGHPWQFAGLTVLVFACWGFLLWSASYAEKLREGVPRKLD